MRQLIYFIAVSKKKMQTNGTEHCVKLPDQLKWMGTIKKRRGTKVGKILLPKPCKFRKFTPKIAVGVGNVAGVWGPSFQRSTEVCWRFF